MFTQRNSIYALIVISVLLIIFNISIEFTAKEEVQRIPVLSQKQIENKFALTLADYRISNNWIKKVFVREKLSDSLDYLFNISIPKDVTIATLIKDINSAFQNPSVIVETKERKNYSNSILKIYYNNELKLQANLNHSKKAIRKFAKYSFLVRTNFNDEEMLWEKLNQLNMEFTYLIVPSQKSVEVKNRLKKRYAIILNDELLDQQFELKENFSKQKLNNNIRSIIIAFGKECAYLIDKSSVLYNSKIFSLLRDELSSRGIELRPLQNFPLLKGHSKEQLVSLFNFYANSLKSKEGKTFIVGVDDFFALQPIIARQLKMGDKIVEIKF